MIFSAVFALAEAIVFVTSAHEVEADVVVAVEVEVAVVVAVSAVNDAV